MEVTVELSSNMTFGQELLVLHTTPTMLSRFLVHAWRVLYLFNYGHTHFGMPQGAKNDFGPK